MDGHGQDKHNLLAGVHAFGRYVAPVGQAPWLHYLLKDNFVMRSTKPSPFYQVIHSAVQDHLHQPEYVIKERMDLMSYFVEAHESQPDLMTERQMTIQAGGNLIAGVLSPGKTFETLFQWLISNQKEQERLHQELSDKSITSPASFGETSELPYLGAVIREAERLHTTAAFTLDRVTSKAGFELPNGVHLPSGIEIGCCIEAVNTDHRIYGHDASSYNPDRWLQQPDESDGAFSERMRLLETTNLTFGQGSRTCIGKNLFKLEAFKGIASLFSQFQVCFMFKHDNGQH